MKKASIMVFAVLLIALCTFVSCKKPAVAEVPAPVETPAEEVTSFKLSFDANGGSGSMKAVTVTGSSVVAPENKFTAPVGYVFESWNTKKDGTGSAYTTGTAINSSKDVTLYATWKADVYDITIGEPDVNGGVVTSTAQIYSISELDQSSTLQLEEVYPGYTFVSYGNDEDGRVKGYPEVFLAGGVESDQAFLVIPTGVIGDIVITPEFKAHTYAISFDANGGVGEEIADTNLLYDVEGNLPYNTFVNELYTFYGWNTKADGTGVNYDEGQAVKNLTTEDGGSVVLYAQWLPYVTVTFKANNGTDDSVTQRIASGYDNDLSVNPFTRVGYDFIGWSTEADGEVVYEEGAVVNTTADFDLYAQWGAIDYDVVMAESETGETESSAVAYNISEEDQYFNLSAEPVSGYKLVGWDVSGANDSYVNGDVLVIPAGSTGAVTVAPVFEKIDYSIQFAENEKGHAEAEVTTYNISDSDQVINLVATANIGYRISSWTTVGNEASYVDGNTLVIPAGTFGDISIVPSFEDCDYSIYYDPNGDDVTGSTLVSDHSFGIEQPLSQNGFFRVGYLFGGWNTEADGSGTAFEDGEIVSGLTADREFTLYAQWIALVPFTVDQSTVLIDGEVLESVYTHGIVLDRKYVMVATGPIYGADGLIISDEVIGIPGYIECPFSAYNGGEGYPLNEAGFGQSYFREADDVVTVIYTHSPVWVLKNF